MAEFTFFAPGIPKPGGSKKGFANKKTGRISIVEDCKGNKDWRSTVQTFATRVLDDLDHAKRELYPLSGPLEVSFVFTMPRSKSHYGTGKNSNKLKPTAPLFHTTKPDCTKLIRSTEDALTHILWVDDAQICIQVGVKRYGEKPGCRVTVKTVDNNLAG